ncbi:MAG: hypothetical protein NZ551_06395 [Microscillaceae bacterium]|nr:hypothetical protein [Microscillaceae bacterium]MDW8460823.1 hypothetical protein [Cytophagales bacterium]
MNQTRSFIIFLVGSLLVMFTMQCAPPRCKIKNCKVVIDHSHPERGIVEIEGESSEGMRKGRVVRGMPYFRYVFKYMFRKRYKAKTAYGKYKKIDSREENGSR